MSEPILAPALSAGPEHSFPRLVADIGGSNARFGWLPHPGAGIGQVHTLPVASHATPLQAAQAYLARVREQAPEAWRPPRHAALAVATAVGADEVQFTNSPWRFSRTALQQALGLDSLLVLNDFEALALSLPCLGSAQRRDWGSAPPAMRGTLAVLGPGTGLGVGAVLHTRAGWQALPGEGGHVTLAAADDLEAQLLAVVRRQHAHVSAERLLSGMGLPVLHQALGEVLGQAVHQAWTAEAVVAEGASGRDALASRTIDLFCALLGGVAGNLVLTVGARSGVFIGGGIVPRFADRFFASAFRERFEAKGRLQPYLSAVPVSLITDTLAALSGTALAISQQVQPAQQAPA